MQHPRGRPPASREDTVTIGTHTPLTGPAAAGYSSISAATEAYFEYVNDNGGINGRSHRVRRQGRRLQPGHHATVVRELVQEDEVFAILNGLGTPTHSAVVDYLNENEVPDLFVASGSPQWNQPDTFPWTFAYNANYIVEAKALATYAQETWPDKTYCVLGQDDDFGTDFTAGLRPRCSAPTGWPRPRRTRSRSRTSSRRSAPCRRPAARSTSSPRSTASRRSRWAPPPR